MATTRSRSRPDPVRAVDELVRVTALASARCRRMSDLSALSQRHRGPFGIIALRTGLNGHPQPSLPREACGHLSLVVSPECAAQPFPPSSSGQRRVVWPLAARTEPRPMPPPWLPASWFAASGTWAVLYGCPVDRDANTPASLQLRRRPPAHWHLLTLGHRRISAMWRALPSAPLNATGLWRHGGAGRRWRDQGRGVVDRPRLRPTRLRL